MSLPNRRRPTCSTRAPLRSPARPPALPGEQSGIEIGFYAHRRESADPPGEASLDQFLDTLTRSKEVGANRHRPSLARDPVDRDQRPRSGPYCEGHPTPTRDPAISSSP